MSNSPYKILIEQIIRKQGEILGLSVAVRRARNVAGLTVDDDSTVKELLGDPVAVVEKLVEQYKALSGNVGVQFCKQAASSWSSLYPSEKLPSILQ